MKRERIQKGNLVSALKQLPEALELLPVEDKPVAYAQLMSIYRTAGEHATEENEPLWEQLLAEIETELDSLAPEAEEARLQIEKAARMYDAFRLNMKPSSKRTLQMSSIVAQVKALAKNAGYDSGELRELFATGSQGDRLVSLAII